MTEQKDWLKLIQDIDKLIKKEYNKVSLAYENSIQYPYTRVSSSLHTITVFLEDIKEKTGLWDDDAKGDFIKNLKASIDNINTIRNSIDTTWKSNDELYDKLKKDFDLLQEKKLKFDNKISSPPKKSDYEREYVDKETNETKIHYPGYDNALKIWKSVCNDLYKDCNIQKKVVEAELKEFKNEAVSAFNVLKTLDFSLLKSPYDLTDLIDNGYVLTGDSALKYLKSGYVAYSIYDSDGKKVTDKIENIDFSTGEFYISVEARQTKGNPYLVAPNGKSFSSRACGVISAAGGLTSVLTRATGELVIVTPKNLAKAMDDYSKDNGGTGFNSYFSSNGMGSYKKLGQAISNNYNVVFAYDESGNASEESIYNIISGGGAFGGSLSERGHIGAITFATDDGGVVAIDTRKNRDLNLSYSYREKTGDGYWRFFSIFPSDSIDITKSNQLIFNGEDKMDIANFSNIFVDGTNYKVQRAKTAAGEYTYTVTE